MEFITLESFVELCKHKSFTIASEYLYISQSSLSKRIASLENEVGTPLIDRSSSRHFELTRAGKEFLEKCTELIQLRDNLVEYIGDVAQNKSQFLRIGINRDEAPPKLIYPILYYYSNLYQETKLTFKYYSSAANRVELLKNAKVDVILSLRMDYENINDISYRVLYPPKRYGVLVRKGHPLANRTSVSIKDLVPYTLVYSSRPGIRETHPLIRAVSEHGYDWKKVIYTHDRHESAAYIVSGDYVCMTIMTELGSVEDFITDLVVRIPLDDFNIAKGDFVIAYNPDNELAAEFADFCTEYVNEHDITSSAE